MTSGMDMNEHCLEREADLSALIDGELARHELIPALDHMASCASCRRFYRAARGLERKLTAAAARPEEPPAPRRTWSEIEASAFEDDDHSESRGPALGARPIAWLPRLAAALLLAVSAWWLWQSSTASLDGGSAERLAERPAELEVTLGEESGRMTEERFIELAAELLRAESRYHAEMLAVMKEVAEATSGRGESSAEGSPTRLTEHRRRSLDEGRGSAESSFTAWQL